MIATDLLGKRLRPERPFGKEGFSITGGIVRAVYLDPENPSRGPMVSLEDDTGHFHNKKLSEMRTLVNELQETAN